MRGHDQVRERSPAAAALDPDDRLVLDTLERTLAYARERDYRGWDYGDGMSSRFRRVLPVESKWVNIAFQEAVKRAPINVRPLLLVERRRNYKGTALFAMANQTVDRLGSAVEGDGERTPGGVTIGTTAGESAARAAAGGSTSRTTAGESTAGTAAGESVTGRASDDGTKSGDRDVDYGREARSLLDWLVDNRSEGYSGYCGGFQHPIQHLDGRGEPREPDIVNTSFGAKALLRAGEYDDRYPGVARSAADFAVEDLNYGPPESGRGAVVEYHTKHPEDYYTVNAGALCARTFVDLYDRFGDPDLRERAEGLLDHIADLQTDRGGWYYRDPPEASHLSMDNHHNGFVVEAFQRHAEVVDVGRYDDTLDAALAFYETLFEDDGAPNFDEESAYPRDVHASTQGILVFTYAGDLAFARRILQWTLENLHAGDGRFYFRKERLFTRRVTLMRWCQAWMAYAMAEYLAARADQEGV